MDIVLEVDMCVGFRCVALTSDLSRLCPAPLEPVERQAHLAEPERAAPSVLVAGQLRKNLSAPDHSEGKPIGTRDLGRPSHQRVVPSGLIRLRLPVRLVCEVERNDES
jgi:hypothetical protein